jgi:putative membrane protein
MKKTIITIFATATVLVFNAQVTESDKKFVKSAMEDGMKEIKLGQLAQTSGTSAEIKKLGRMMEEDHTKASDELKAWATRKNVTLPAGINDEAQKEYDKMSKNKGREFDREYAKCMVKDHKKAVGDFKKAAEKCDDAELKSWAAKTLPTLEHHLKMSEQALDAVKEEKKDDKDMKGKSAKK